MGSLSALLSLPVSGPMSGLTWLARQIEKAALQEMLDPARIETALLALERRLEAGEIDEETFEAEEERLLEELSEITALRAAETETDEDEDDPTTVMAGEGRPSTTWQPLQPPTAPALQEEDAPEEAWTPA